MNMGIGVCESLVAHARNLEGTIVDVAMMRKKVNEVLQAEMEAIHMEQNLGGVGLSRSSQCIARNRSGYQVAGGFSCSTHQEHPTLVFFMFYRMDWKNNK